MRRIKLTENEEHLEWGIKQLDLKRHALVRQLYVGGFFIGVLFLFLVVVIQMNLMGISEVEHRLNELPSQRYTCTETSNVTEYNLVIPYKEGIDCYDVCDRMRECVVFSPNKDFCVPAVSGSEFVSDKNFNDCIDYYCDSERMGEIINILLTPIMEATTYTNCTRYEIELWKPSNERISETREYHKEIFVQS